MRRGGRVLANIAESFDFRLLEPRLRVRDKIAGQAIEYAFEGFVKLQFFGSVRINPLDFPEEALEDRNAFADLSRVKKMGLVAVVKIGGVVADFVGEIDELGFERRTLIEKILAPVPDISAAS